MEPMPVPMPTPTQMTWSAIVGLLEWLAAPRQAARIAGKSMGGDASGGLGSGDKPRVSGRMGDFSWRLMTFFTFTGRIRVGQNNQRFGFFEPLRPCGCIGRLGTVPSVDTARYSRGPFSEVPRVEDAGRVTHARARPTTPIVRL